MMMRRVPYTVLFLALLCCFCSHVYATDDDDDMVRVSAEVLCRSGNSSALWRLTGEREWKVCGPDKNPGSRDAMDEEDPYAIVCNVARPSCMDFNATSTSRKEGGIHLQSSAADEQDHRSVQAMGKYPF
ncbi:hypothetical protein TcBrA4_0047900 [Trypanosoma cruzi]|nr:hypothetical protein TcBrA4_0047900 [Trypanosoma cruzi]